MSTEIRVPTLGESVTEATVARWLKAVGDMVKRDEAVLELETDKISLEITATEAGKLTEQTVKQGDTVEVGAILGRIVEGAAAPAQAAAPAPIAKPAAAATAPSVKPNGAGHHAPTAPTASATAPSAQTADDDQVMLPSVRKLVEEHVLDLRKIKGSGPGGRVLKGDVLAAVEARKSEAAPATAPAQAPAPAQPASSPASSPAPTPAPAAPVARPDGAREERVPMSRLRKRVAERLKQAQNTAAMLTTFNDVDMSAVMAARAAYKETFEKKHGAKLGFMSFFVKASIQALKEIPAVNAEISGEDIVYKHYYNIGVALSAPQGLVVPVLRDADRMNFAGIEKAIIAFGQKARDNKLAIDDLTGGTFTITNGGIFGSMLSTPILNPPQVGILGMHKIQERPVALDGKVEIRPMMYLALSYDHRLIDGREAVTFLVRIKECLEDPQRLLLEI
ncbi:MAG: 2-oxoglutarate dehydrogenase complex dihydrolipoyllysine-residue succinyltransferase [Alphaproteobacteria bacterium]|nr:2-oxoglutarate dehydrogenase complex dihydrolipoyllysine-residue succinyltransferase [Alphaproteobacteria bacterium]